MDISSPSSTLMNNTFIDEKRWLPVLLLSVPFLLTPFIYQELGPGAVRADEWSHWHQILKFTEGKYLIIQGLTTIPGYHAVMALLIKITGFVHVPQAKFLSIAMSLPSLFFVYLICRRGSTSRTAAMQSIQYWFCPLMLPYFYVFYTDMFSATFILLGAWMFLKERFIAAAFALTVSMLVRQNNIIWLGMFYFIYLSQRGFFMEALGLFKTPRTQLLPVFLGLVRKAFTGWAFLLGISAFIGFFIYNGSVAIGDTISHPVSKLYTSQMFFLLFTVGVLFLPLHIENMAKIVKMVNRYPYFWALLAFAFIVFLFSYDTSHYYNQDNNFIRNRFLLLANKSMLLKIVIFLFSMLAVLSLCVIELKEKCYYWIYPFSVFAVLPAYLIEQRYFIIPVILFMLCRKFQSERAEILTLAWFTVLSAFLIHEIGKSSLFF